MACVGKNNFTYCVCLFAIFSYFCKMEEYQQQINYDETNDEVNDEVQNDEILPLSIWDALADSDLLIEYVRKFDDSIINVDAGVRKKIFTSMYSYSKEIIPEVEQYFCEKFYISLKIFLDRTEKKWKNQEQ